MALKRNISRIQGFGGFGQDVPEGRYVETLRPPGSVYTEEEWLTIMKGDGEFISINRPPEELIYDPYVEPRPYIETLRPPGSAYTEEEWLEIMKEKQQLDQPTVADIAAQDETALPMAGFPTWGWILLGGVALFILSRGR